MSVYVCVAAAAAGVAALVGTHVPLSRHREWAAAYDWGCFLLMGLSSYIRII